MTDKNTGIQRGIGLTSIGNANTLIAQLEKFKELGFKENVFICLNIFTNTSEDNFEKLKDDFYKIVKNYDQYFSKIYVIESVNAFLTHGSCLDVLFNTMIEFGIEEMAFFEEDAFIFKSEILQEWFNKLKDHHLHCVVDVDPNEDYSYIFKKLDLLDNTINTPGKESIFFVKKDILDHYDWLSFDYIVLDKKTKIKISDNYKLSLPRDTTHFDTFHFFSLICWTNPKIKCSIYNEERLHFLEPDSIDAGRISEYVHYFNSALYTHLDFHGENEKKILKELLMTEGAYGAFPIHIHTWLVHASLLFSIRKKYINILGIDRYREQRNSQKRIIKKYLNYFGWYHSTYTYKIKEVFKRVFKYVNKMHG